MRQSVETRFWQKVKKTEGCWVWTGAIITKGYGQIRSHDSKRVLAHRLSYEINVGKIPCGMLVLHKCDNPPCVNPDHLFLGTYQDNVLDAMSKGRMKPPTGSGENRKLSEEDVISILNQRLALGKKQIEIAVEFGVSKQMVSHICRGYRWGKVSGL